MKTPKTDAAWDKLETELQAKDAALAAAQEALVGIRESFSRMEAIGCSCYSDPEERCEYCSESDHITALIEKIIRCDATTSKEASGAPTGGAAVMNESWEADRLELQDVTIPKLRIIGHKCRLDAEDGNVTAKRVMALYTLLYRSFDPLTHLQLKAAIAEYEKESDPTH